MTDSWTWEWLANPYLSQRQYHRHSLQKYLENAEADKPFQIPGGEYLGPMIIKQPLILQGNGRETIFWNYHNPILYIAAQGVKLYRIAFEFSEDSNSPQILYFEGCEPELIDCHPNDLRIAPMLSQNMINLGTLAAGTEVELPILFSNSESWDNAGNVFHADFGKIEQGIFSRRGFNLKVQAPKDDGYIIEEFPITSSKDRHKKDLLLFGRVVEKLAEKPVKQILVLKLNDGRRIYLHQSFQIGAKELEILSRVSNISDAVYSMFIKDNNDNWCFWLPYKPAEHILLDQARLEAWSRIPVLINQSFKIGSFLDFKIEQESNMPLKLPRSMTLDVGDLNPISIELPISFNQGIKIFAAWEGRVEALLPWIKVSQPQVKLSGAMRQGKSDNEVEIIVSPELGQLQNGKYRYCNALMIHNERDIFFMDIELNVQIAAKRLDVLPKEFMLKNVDGSDLFAGELSGLEMGFEVVSVGRDTVHVQISPKVDWLEIPNGARDFTLDAGERVTVPFRLNDRANLLPENDKYYLSHAIVINNQDIPNSQNSVAIAIRADIKTARKPQITILSQPKPFPVYNLDQPEKLETNFTLGNQGYATGFFRIVAPDYIQLSQEQGSLARKDQVKISIRPDQQYLQSLASNANVEVEIQILVGSETDNLIETERIKLKIVTVDLFPVLECEPNLLDFGTFVENQDINGEVLLTITNQGGTDYQGKVTSQVIWLDISDNNIKLKPKESKELKLRLNHQPVQRLKPQIYEEQSVLKFSSSQRLRTDPKVQARLRIQAAAPLLHVHQEFLWFGKVEQGKEHLPSSELVIGNYGTKEWRGRISHLSPWLRVEESNLRIPAGKILRLLVRVNSEVARMSAGAHYYRGAIVISEDHSQHTVNLDARFFLVAPSDELRFKPDKLHLGDYLEGGKSTVTHEILLENDGGLDWQWNESKSSCPKWLEFMSPLPHELESGKSQIIRLRLLPAALNYPDDYMEDLVLYSQAGRMSRLTVKAIVAKLDIEVGPPKLNLKQASKRRQSSGSPSPSQFFIHNRSQAPFALSTDNVYIPNYLEASPAIENRVLRAGERAVFNLAMIDSEAFGDLPPIEVLLPTGRVEVIEIYVEA